MIATTIDTDRLASITSLDPGGHATVDDENALLARRCRYRSDGIPVRGQPLVDRVFGRVEVQECGCWNHQGRGDEDGYRKLKTANGERKAHRVAWILAYGPIPDGQVVCHRCDNTACVRPSHLFLGSIAENNRDRHRKGRTAMTPLVIGRTERVQRQRLITHCPAGHAYAGDNLGIRANGARYCRACRKAYSRDRRALRRQEGHVA